MRLRRPCPEHNRYDEHTVLPDQGFSFICPGGEFLPEDALVIEKVDGEFPEWIRKAAIEQTAFELVEALKASVAKAAADQVGEQ